MRYTSVATALLLAAMSATDARAQEYPKYGQMVAVGGFIGSLDVSKLYQFSNGTTWNVDTGCHPRDGRTAAADGRPSATFATRRMPC